MSQSKFRSETAMFSCHPPCRLLPSRESSLQGLQNFITFPSQPCPAPRPDTTCGILSSCLQIHLTAPAKQFARFAWDVWWSLLKNSSLSLISFFRNIVSSSISDHFLWRTVLSLPHWRQAWPLMSAHFDWVNVSGSNVRQRLQEP